MQYTGNSAYYTGTEKSVCPLAMANENSWWASENQNSLDWQGKEVQIPELFKDMVYGYKMKHIYTGVWKLNRNDIYTEPLLNS